MGYNIKLDIFWWGFLKINIHKIQQLLVSKFFFCKPLIPKKIWIYWEIGLLNSRVTEKHVYQKMSHFMRIYITFYQNKIYFLHCIFIAYSEIGPNMFIYFLDIIYKAPFKGPKLFSIVPSLLRPHALILYRLWI